MDGWIWPIRGSRASGNGPSWKDQRKDLKEDVEGFVVLADERCSRSQSFETMMRCLVFILLWTPKRSFAILAAVPAAAIREPAAHEWCTALRSLLLVLAFVCLCVFDCIYYIQIRCSVRAKQVLGRRRLFWPWSTLLGIMHCSILPLLHFQGVSSIPWRLSTAAQSDKTSQTNLVG